MKRNGIKVGNSFNLIIRTAGKNCIRAGSSTLHTAHVQFVAGAVISVAAVNGRAGQICRACKVHRVIVAGSVLRVAAINITGHSTAGDGHRIAGCGAGLCVTTHEIAYTVTVAQCTAADGYDIAGSPAIPITAEYRAIYRSVIDSYLIAVRIAGGSRSCYGSAATHIAVYCTAAYRHHIAVRIARNPCPLNDSPPKTLPPMVVAPVSEEMVIWFPLTSPVAAESLYDAPPKA